SIYVRICPSIIKAFALATGGLIYILYIFYIIFIISGAYSGKCVNQSFMWIWDVLLTAILYEAKLIIYDNLHTTGAVHDNDTGNLHVGVGLSLDMM
ncbi:hypothetical protein ACJX0J_016325, partial [Zea mays]